MAGVNGTLEFVRFAYLLQLILITLKFAEVGEVATWSIWTVLIPMYALLVYMLAGTLVVLASMIYLRRKEPR